MEQCDTEALVPGIRGVGECDCLGFAPRAGGGLEGSSGELCQMCGQGLAKWKRYCWI